MKNIVRGIGRLALLGLFIALTIITAAKEVQATAIASVNYLETWDAGNSEWDYEYYVANNSDAGELLYDFFLDMLGLGATLSNISDPVNWEHFTDNSTFIESSSILFTGSEIVPGNSLIFLFSSDIQLGNLYYQTLFDDGSITDGTSTPVPEPATMFLLGTGFLGLFTLRRWKDKAANLF